MIVPFLAWAATVAEIVLAALLLVGWQLRKAALASGILLLSFALTMAFASSIKAPLDYSVYTASAAMLVLASQSFRIEDKRSAGRASPAEDK